MLWILTTLKDKLILPSFWLPLKGPVTSVSGFLCFTIPFVFAFYPELLLIEAAQEAQSIEGGAALKSYLPGYDGTVSMGPLLFLVFKLIVSLYLLASALMKYDADNIKFLETILRITLAVLILVKAPVIGNTALVIGIAVLILHQFTARIRKTRRANAN